MNIEKKIAIVRKALENGAAIRMSFDNVIGIGQAEKLIANLVPTELMEHNQHKGAQWFSFRDYDAKFDITAFYDNSLEERKLYETREFEKFMDDDVQLDGMPDA